MRATKLSIILIFISSILNAKTLILDSSADTLCPNSTVEVKLDKGYNDSTYWQDSTVNTTWDSVDYQSDRYDTLSSDDTLKISGIDSSYKVYIRALIDSNNSKGFEDTSATKKIIFEPSLSWKDTIEGQDTVCEGDMVTYTIDTTNTTIDSIKWDIGQIKGNTVGGINDDSLKIAFSGKSNDTIKVIVTNYCGKDSFSKPIKFYDTVGSTTISSNQSICYNNSPKKVKLDSVPSGGGDNLKYQWLKKRVDNSSWSSIPKATDTSYKPESLTDTNQYRLKYTSDVGCGVDTSNQVTINVYPKMDTGKVGFNPDKSIDTVCYGNRPNNNIKLVDTLAGGGGNFNYRWQKRTDSTAWYTIPNANSDTFKPGKLDTTSYYQLKIMSKEGCDTIITDSVEVFVLDSFEAPEIGFKNNLTKDTTICYTTSLDSIIVDTSATGAGSQNNHNYQWQLAKLKNDSLSQFSNTSISDSTSFKTNDLEDTTYYRLKVTSDYDCGTVYSDTLIVNVYDSLKAGSIEEIDSVCYNNKPNTLEVENSAMGGGQAFDYRWQKKINSWNTATNKADTTIYKPIKLTQSTNYRLKFISKKGCGAVNSNPIKIKVFDSIKNPKINSDTTICYKATPKNIFLDDTLKGGGGGYKYIWQDSTNNESWSDSIGNGTFFNPNKLEETTYYRLKVKSRFNCTTHSNKVAINVYDSLNSGRIVTDTSICFDSRPNKLRLDPKPSGGGDSFIFNWQKSKIEDNQWDSVGFNNPRYQPDKLKDTTQYRAVIKSKRGCGYDTTNSTKIEVYNEFDIGNIAFNNKFGTTDTICQKERPDSIVIKDAASGGAQPYKYQWQYREDDTSWDTINKAYGQRHKPKALSDTTFFRLEISSAKGCSTDTTNSVEAIVNPLPPPLKIDGDSLVCRNSRHKVYNVDTSSKEHLYRWDAPRGTIRKGKWDANKTIIDWHDQQARDTLFLLHRIKATGCDRYKPYPITLTSNRAPEPPDIKIKPNTSILVCSDSTADHFQWGFDFDNKDSTVSLKDETLRYVQLSHPLDTSKFNYWVKTYNINGNDSCVTKTYFDKRTYTSRESEIKQPIKFYPNPVENQLKVDGIELREWTIKIFNIDGKSVQFKANKNTIEFNRHLPNGMYFIYLKNEQNVVTQKIMLSR